MAFHNGFVCSDGSRLCELRRGISRQVTVYSLIFSLNGRFLVCSSNTSTVHIFKLFREQEKKTPKPLVTFDYPSFMAFSIHGILNFKIKCSIHCRVFSMPCFLFILWRSVSVILIVFYSVSNCLKFLFSAMFYSREVFWWSTLLPVRSRGLPVTFSPID